ncbi:MAG: hypothetical protein IKD79_06355 [Oscillospiraceae bacterium]|nr:hypothetical protein [Oscillospiraceae bacterium]
MRDPEGEEVSGVERLTMFYLPGCPYCRKAGLALEALMEAEPAYREIGIDRIDESR